MSEDTSGQMAPKVFISYSWTSPGYKAAVKEWADRLIADGVNVVIDIYELKEGDDKYAFMERMVTDSTMTHVLLLCNKEYSEKADARRAGVGTESQIVSREIYEKVKQSKFIPIVCEFGAEGAPYVPTFLKSRIWIDFSTPEAVNENWEQLVRVLHGKPLYRKPELGKPPAYLTDALAPASPALAKLNDLRSAIRNAKPTLNASRQEFIEACVATADALRIRQAPDRDNFAQRVLADCGKLKVVRDLLIDWSLFEASVAITPDFQEAVLNVLERLLELKARPREVTQWNDGWFQAHSVFVYETFLYIIAALIKRNAFSVLHEVFSSHYLKPDTESSGNPRFGTFDEFYGYSEALQSVLAPVGRKLASPAAELIKRQADRSDLPFQAVMEAEVLVLMMSFVTATRWFPQTLLYSHGEAFPFFLRATQHKGFRKLAMVTGIDSAEALRAAIAKGREQVQTSRWTEFWLLDRSFAGIMNLEKLDTLK